MSYFNKHAAMTNAVAIVTAALQSGAIKLPGSNNFASDQAENAAADAQYLNKLLNLLAENLTSSADERR
jgi:hypothetical protein